MSLGRPVVLLVDDDELAREATRSYLLAHGFDVIAVNGADAGLHILQNERVNAVVSDFEMPKMDGLQFAAAVYKHDPTLPFFIMSGREAPSNVDPQPYAAWINKGSSLAALCNELLLGLSGKTRTHRSTLASTATA
jgi:CheY-like chemotaxis protein